MTGFDYVPEMRAQYTCRPATLLAAAERLRHCAVQWPLLLFFYYFFFAFGLPQFLTHLHWHYSHYTLT